MAAAPESRAARAPGSVWGWTAVSVAAILMLYPMLSGGRAVSGYVYGILVLAAINITLAVSLNIINGMTGQFSIGHAGFVAVGAYVGAAVTVFGGTALERLAGGGVIDPAHPALNLFLVRVGDAPPAAGAVVLGQVSFLIASLIGGLAAAAMGILVGVPTLHLRGDYLAIATLGFGEITRVILLNMEVVGGASGFNGRPPFGRIPPYTNLANAALVALVCILTATNLKRSIHGRALLAIQDDEVAAEAVGIDTTRYKVFAFALSAFFAGVAGSLLAHDQGNINPRMFGFMLSITVIVMVVLGGSGSTTGAALAAVVLTILPEWLRDLEQWRMVLYAEILLVMMLVRRQGLLGARELTSADWSRWLGALRDGGGRGLLASGRALLGRRRGELAGKLVRPGASRFQVLLAAVALLLPFADVLAAWLLPPATQPYPRTYAAEIVGSLSFLLDGFLHHVPALAPLADGLLLPLAPNLGLSVALLALLLPWCAMAFGLAAGDRRAGAGLLLAAGLALWHGGGLMAMGSRHPRTVVEAAAAAVLLLAALLWLARRRAD